MAVISSNSLFHFTPTLSNLINILSKEFYPRYRYENFFFKQGSLDGAMPMVCFCDLSVSQLKRHIQIYGNYGLGMKKEWGKEKGINPMLYLSEDSILSNSINDILVYLAGNNDQLGLTTANSAIRFLSFIKPYEGEFNQKERTYQSFRFYNEREWRYVPELLNDRDPLPFIPKVDHENNEYAESMNLTLQQYQLGFSPNDIRYIIINSESEILTTIESLRRAKKNYSKDVVDILSSKIVTVDQIKEDF